MGKIVWSEVFPNNASVAIFIGYMSLFVGQGILVTWSQEETVGKGNGYTYNTVTVVLLTEVLKLVVSVLLYQRENTLSSLVPSIYRDRTVLWLYFVPSVLYCFYNNLAFVNLSVFDPTTYYLLLQFRVVITGVLFQLIFRKSLSCMQWMSLLLLTTGCMIKQLDLSAIDPSSIDAKSSTASLLNLSPNVIFILVQAVCSCLAGVYNEYLLKNQGAHVNIYVQNVFMYLDSIICNVMVLIITGDLLTAFTAESLGSIWRIDVILIMFNNAAIGIVTSFFLKYMNSILKTFASALELVFTAILCRVLFAIPIYLNTVLSIGVVSAAIYLYSQNPVTSVRDAASSEESAKKRNEDSKPLLHDKVVEV